MVTAFADEQYDKLYTYIVFLVTCKGLQVWNSSYILSCDVQIVNNLISMFKPFEGLCCAVSSDTGIPHHRFLLTGKQFTHVTNVVINIHSVSVAYSKLTKDFHQRMILRACDLNH